MSFSFAATQPGLSSAPFLEIFSFFQLKIVIIRYESLSLGCADMVAIQSSGSMVADMITALTHTIVKHRKMEPISIDVWKMRMQLLLKEQDLFFFFILEKREARRSGANGFLHQVMLCCCSQTTKESIWRTSIVVDSKKKVLRSCANGGQG